MPEAAKRLLEWNPKGAEFVVLVRPRHWNCSQKQLATAFVVTHVALRLLEWNPKGAAFVALVRPPIEPKNNVVRSK
jgi:hypothetical protein